MEAHHRIITLERRSGSIRALVAAPREPCVAGLGTLAQLRGKPGPTHVDDALLSAFERETEATVIIDAPSHANDPSRWRIDDNLSDSDGGEIAYRMIRARLPTYRALLCAGVWAVVMAGWREREGRLFAMGTARVLDEVVAALVREQRRDPRSLKLRALEADRWALRRMLFTLRANVQDAARIVGEHSARFAARSLTLSETLGDLDLLRTVDTEALLRPPSYEHTGAAPRYWQDARLHDEVRVREVLLSDPFGIADTLDQPAPRRRTSGSALTERPDTSTAPARRPSPATARAKASPRSPPMTPSPESVKALRTSMRDSASGLRVLVVDDNEVSRRVIGGMVRLIGGQATVVSTGRAGLAAFELGHQDLVLVDCQMPEMDGYEFTRKLRSLEGALGVRPFIAAVTGTLDEDARSQGSAAGMDEMIEKPLQTSTLAELARSLERHADAEANLVHVDHARIDELRALDRRKPGVLDQAFATFLAQIPRRLDQLRSAEGDADAVARQAEMIALSADSVGAPSVAAAARRLVDPAASGTLNSRIHTLSNVFGAARPEFETLKSAG